MLLLSALTAEAAYRGWVALRWGAYSRAGTRQRLAEMRDAVLGLRPNEAPLRSRTEPAGEGSPWSVHPYLGFDLSQTPAQIDEELALLRGGRETFDILLVGGSVAADFGYWGRSAFFEALAADPKLAGKELRLFNYARPAHKQPQQLVAVEYLFALGFVPNAVVSVDGFNEVAVAAGNAGRGVHPSHPANEQWVPLFATASGDTRAFELAAEVFARREELLGALDAAADSALLASALASRPLVGAVNRRQVEYAAAVDRYTRHLAQSSANPAWRGPRFAADEPSVLDLCVRVWRESARSLAAVCASRGIACAIVLQPTLHDEGAKPLTAREVEQGGAQEAWLRAARLGYPLLRAAGDELRAQGVPFFDASGAFRAHGEELYFDVCHFGEAGHRIFAREVARALLAQL